MDPEMIPSDCEDEPTTKRCTVRNGPNWQCSHTMPITYKFKMCPKHRARAVKNSKRPRAIEYEANRRSSQTYKEQRRVWDATYLSKPGNAERQIQAQKDWLLTPKGQAMTERRKKDPLRRLTLLLRAMIKGEKTESLIRMGCFESTEHVKTHFESTWQSWMNWENYGKNPGVGYRLKWNFGHKLPCAIFDGSNPNDRRKCFLPMNLYAQDAKDNNEKHAKLVYSDIELEALRPCWPDAAKNSLVLLKALFAGAAARAVAEGSSSSTHSAAADSEAEAQAEDSEVDLAEDSGAESEAETEAEDSEAEG